MARAQVREVSGPAAIRGIAAPVNTYVRPANPAPSSLHQLAEGLSALDSGLGAFLDKRTQDQNELDKERGAAAFNRSNRVAWGEAVKQGLVPPNASPVYMEWYKKSQGNLAGLKLREEAVTAWQTWDGRNSGDPAKFEEWLGGFLKERLSEETDPHVLAGLNPHVDALFTESFDRFGTERAKAVKDGALGTQGGLIISTIDGLEQDGRTQETGTDYDSMWSSITALREEALVSGVLAADYDATLVDSIILEAKRTNNDELLMLLEKPLPGQDKPMSFDLEVRTKRDAAMEEINNSRARQETATATAREKLDKQQHEQKVATVVRMIAEDQNAVIPDELINELSRRDGNFRVTLEQYRKNFADAGVLEDPTAVAQVFSDIHAGASESDVNAWFQNGTIKTRETYVAALDRVEKLRKSAAEGGGLMGDATAKRYRDKFRSDLGAGELDIYGTKGLNEESMQAMQDFDMALIEWEEANPKATFVERQKFINEAGAAIQNRITVRGADGGEYDSLQDQALRDKELKAQIEVDRQERMQQLYIEQEQRDLEDAAEEEAQIEADRAGPPMSAAETPKGEFDPLRKPPKVQDLVRDAWDFITGDDADVDPTTRAIRTLSKRYNLSEEEAKTMFRERFKGLTGTEYEEPAVDPTTTNSIPDEQRSQLEGALRASYTPEAGGGLQPMLDLIGNLEGTDKGRGYNETLGYGLLTGGDVDLVDMTLGDIDKLQTQMLRHPDNKWNSSALGRYQVVQMTLREMRKELGLGDDVKFTAEVQDQVATKLLERRGMGDLKAGKITGEQFLAKLSDEWASFPKQVSATATKPKGKGLEALAPNGLVSSAKRGSAPDLENLKPELRAGVEDLQKAWGRELPIVSGFRDATRNRKAGGAKKSQHMHGNAVDIDVSGLSTEERLQLIALASEKGFGGIGVYANSLHLDKGSRRAWGPNYSRSSVPKWAAAAITQHVRKKA